MKVQPVKSGTYIIGDRAYKLNSKDRTIEFYSHINSHEDYPAVKNQDGHAYSGVSEFLEYNKGWREE